MELGGPSKDRKVHESNEYDDNSMTNISLSLSNSSPPNPIQEESKLPSYPESSTHYNPNHMRNDIEIPLSTSCSSSSINSVVTVEGNRENHGKSSGGELLADHDASCSMVLAGCPRCLMYVMLWKNNPRCPKCNTSTLLNLFHSQ